MYFVMAFVALVIDRAVVWPDWLGRIFSHPVVWQGKLIEIMETRFNRSEFSGRTRRLLGLLMLTVLVGTTLFISLVIVRALALLPYGWLIEALLASVFLAHRSLAEAVTKIADTLDISIEQGRVALSHIVGRDTANLNEHEIARAAIESLAENSSDGVIAPLFWLVLFGLPGIAIYKAINTADSMVGHKNLRFVDFGWASARLDDVVNWLPARLSALLYVLASFFVHGASPSKSLDTARRDASGHVSPNAGWPEAAMAGALGFSLGGPRSYQGKMLDLAIMGDGKRELEASDIRLALKLFAAMTLLAMFVVALATLFQFGQFAL
ncbi:Adenosylcobinamide-phosphate synthase [hydrothermal vent metagenome]|uniref:Adenosylcobinamide-phosphate synthase n=1 Tax=hydrothermal vent metagenome TaxID=652676 RepID=A0A3B0TNY4_9ZZZZ